MGTSEGPYKVERRGENTSTVLDAFRKIVCTTDDEDADRICDELNLAHAHATAAAARRVRELEEALAAHRAVWDAVNRYDYCMCREPEKQNAAYYELRALHKKVLDVDVWGMEALAGKERTDGAE